MKLWDMIAMSLSNLFKRKVRTLLTVAGVVIGTCAIVVMLSFGIGIKESMKTMMEGMGDLTVIQIYSGSRGGSGMVVEGNMDGGGGSDSKSVLDDKAVEQIRKLPAVVAVTPMYDVNYDAFTIRSGKYDYNGQICGVDFAALKEFGYNMEQGQFPEKNFDEETILFGQSALYQFCNMKKTSNGYINPEPDSSGKMPDPYVDPINDKLELIINEQRDDSKNDDDALTQKKSSQKPVKLKCVGIMADDWSKNPPPGDSVFMDINFAKKLMQKYNKVNKIKTNANSEKGYENVCVKTKSINDVAVVEQSIHDMGFSNTNSMDSIRKPLEEQTKTIQMILGGLGAISLLVAALGITNTMIMSIYERTREIGVMKVLGCIVGNIRTMFLLEAGAIGFIGGLMGILFSYGISFGINSIAGQAMQNGNSMSMIVQTGSSNISIIPIWLAASALIFATMVGLVSGFYPANRAVKISALTAIKQE